MHVFKLGFEDWDIIGQGTASLTTIAAVVKQDEGDKYVTSSLVLSFIHTCMKSLAEHGSIKQSWFGPAILCHQPMNPSNQHAAVFGKTSRTDGSQT